jgi:hypothetical protein
MPSRGGPSPGRWLRRNPSRFRRSRSQRRRSRGHPCRSSSRPHRILGCRLACLLRTKHVPPAAGPDRPKRVEQMAPLTAIMIMAANGPMRDYGATEHRRGDGSELGKRDAMPNRSVPLVSGNAPGICRGVPTSNRAAMTPQQASRSMRRSSAHFSSPIPASLAAFRLAWVGACSQASSPKQGTGGSGSGGVTDTGGSTVTGGAIGGGGFGGSGGSEPSGGTVGSGGATTGTGGWTGSGGRGAGGRATGGSTAGGAGGSGAGQGGAGGAATGGSSIGQGGMAGSPTGVIWQQNATWGAAT